MKNKYILNLLILFLLSGCIGASSTGVFGTGVSIAMDPRTLGTQIDDSIMDKSLDARIFLTGKNDTPEEKLQITKLAWETKGARSVKNDLKIKEEFNFQQSAKDILITSQLRSAMIFNKKIKAVNYNIDTFKKVIYVYGIAQSEDEKDEIVKEAKEILDVKDVITSILLVEDLRIKKD